MDVFSAQPAADVRLRRLFWLRNVGIGGQVLAIAVADRIFGVALPLAALAGVIGLLVLVNVATAWRLQAARPAGDAELFGQLVADVVLLSAALYVTGGATNPFVSLYLLPLTIAATVLPARHVWAMAALTVLAYSLLMFVYRPLASMQAQHGGGFGLHVLGMWFNFIVSAALIAIFVARMAVSLRERERELARARERALRDEQLVTLGTFAAGAAHELSTPLSTIAVLAGELEHAAGADTVMRGDLRTLRRQVDTCKQILSDMVARTGRARSEGARLRCLGDLVEDAVTRWRVLRPGATVRVICPRGERGPLVAAEETAVQALVSLLNNAADAAPDAVELWCDWDDSRVRLEIRDRGPGIGASVAELAGLTPYSAKAHKGLGLGLLLASASIERLGGELKLANRDDGGAVTRVSLPIGVAA